MTLSTKELADMRAIIKADLMPDTCNILSVTDTADSQGGFTQVWGTATVDAKCRLDELANPIEAIGGESLRPFSTYILTLPHDTTITVANRVEVGSNTFNVSSVDSGKSWKASIRCRLELV